MRVTCSSLMNFFKRVHESWWEYMRVWGQTGAKSTNFHLILSNIWANWNSMGMYVYHKCMDSGSSYTIERPVANHWLKAHLMRFNSRGQCSSRIHLITRCPILLLSVLCHCFVKPLIESPVCLAPHHLTST